VTDAIVCDLDDYCDAHAGWALPLLDQLYQRSGGRFKATLFAIPGRLCGDALIDAAGRPYLELAVHGWGHALRECEHWTQEQTAEVLARCLAAGRQHEEDNPYYTAIFKAPYWVTSPGLYAGLLASNWAVADHPQNLTRIPRALRRYVLSPSHRIGAAHHVLPVIQAHGHFTNETGNGLRECLGSFVGLAESGRPFKFVSEVLV